MIAGKHEFLKSRQTHEFCMGFVRVLYGENLFLLGNGFKTRFFVCTLYF